MKITTLLGVFALIFLVQTPLIFSLDLDYCDDVDREYRSDCRKIIRMDELRNSEKRDLIDALDDYLTIQNTQQYPSLFTNQYSPPSGNNFYYNPKEKIDNRLKIIYKFILFTGLNYFMFILVKRSWGKYL